MSYDVVLSFLIARRV